jgi:predicted alpha/beta hydrolase
LDLKHTDWKTSAVLEKIMPQGLELYGEVCGSLLARAHARSGDRIAIASYLGKSDSFDRALAEFAVAYADQNERDHAAVRKAADEGRIKASEGL